ncbi:MAG: class IV adenylate cyclase [candidate division KSB1 bacterium]|nr:class IV adenylate cyclase [candidate division KSB1 bacterium]MDZ7335953.1 class IV adenylate cyclase [candidate division KSB1 bacterium]MDZ7357747.1 class IV adenylate cyclase [candidate division KSB1 bacterium]MDZ7399856.1 class IV adenylate cyclase [candidate division KSB1 bacterium]
MNFINVEIKARCDDPDRIRAILKSHHAKFHGNDHQIDTYFQCAMGRLKLREGDIENYLIHYEREDRSGPKQSAVTLYQPQPDSSLKQILAKALGILVVVDKQREIYFIDNVKFHIDMVKGLGSFIEIEAIDLTGEIGVERLRQQCNFYRELLGIHPDALIARSYSDLLRESRQSA